MVPAFLGPRERGGVGERATKRGRGEASESLILPGRIYTEALSSSRRSPFPDVQKPFSLYTPALLSLRVTEFLRDTGLAERGGLAPAVLGADARGPRLLPVSIILTYIQLSVSIMGA